jgi:hypothetical protein
MMAKGIFLKHLLIRVLMGVPFSLYQILHVQIAALRPYYLFVLLSNALVISIEQYFMYAEFQQQTQTFMENHVNKISTSIKRISSQHSVFERSIINDDPNKVRDN